jgi:hypothetical protein
MARTGDIIVLIPSNLAVSIAARNDSGPVRIVSDFPQIRVRPAALIRPPLTAEGSINGGGPMLYINAAGGVIYLRKK